MRVLYISTPFFADCDFPLIKAFQQHGVDITYLILLAPFSLRSTIIDIKKQIPHTGIFPATDYVELKDYENYMDMSKVFVSNRISPKSYSYSYWKETCLLYKFIRDGHFDIIHTDSIFEKFRTFLYQTAPKWVVTIHDPIPHSSDNAENVRGIRMKAIKVSQKIVLLNQKQLNPFCELYRVNQNKVALNRLGAYENVRAFINPGIKQNKNNILFFGRISPYKGLEYLCKAMLKVRQVIPDASLTIAGGGKMYFDLSDYQSQDWFELRNRYIGTKELAELLQKCSISVCPYTDATQSGVIMTSFGLCKPVVATNVGGLGEMIDDGITGVLVPSKDVDALADGIIKILCDSQRLSIMEQNIRNEYFSGEKSWSSIAKKYINIYSEI